jgi:hypothetical protein
MPIEDIEVSVERDSTEERKGVYRLHATLALTGGALTEEQRQELLNVAGKCPVHRLMTQVTTEIAPIRACRLRARSCLSKNCSSAQQGYRRGFTVGCAANASEGVARLFFDHFGPLMTTG